VSAAGGGRTIDRRSFLLLRPTDRARVFELSCEQLYMRYVDARLPKRRDRLFDQLTKDLVDVEALRVVDREWLSDEELKARVERLLDELRARGVRIDGTNHR
jgi:hypothetical protein